MHLEAIANNDLKEISMNEIAAASSYFSKTFWMPLKNTTAMCLFSTFVWTLASHLFGLNEQFMLNVTSANFCILQ